MEENKTGMEEAANLGGAAVAMAFDIASGNYVRAGVTGVISFGKYVFILLLSFVLLISITVNLIPIIIGNILGFKDSSQYVLAASSYDRVKIKDFVEERDLKDDLSEILTPFLDAMAIEKQQELMNENEAYAEYVHTIIPLEESFFTEKYSDWLAGIILHEADHELLQRMKEANTDDQEIIEDLLSLLGSAEDKHLQIHVEIVHPETRHVLLLYGPDIDENGEKTITDTVIYDELTIEQIEWYLKNGYVEKMQTTKGEVFYFLLPEDVGPVNVKREYILVKSEEEIRLAVEMLKIIGSEGSLAEKTKRIFEEIGWLQITGEEGDPSFGGSPIITATIDDVIDSWEGVSEIRKQICEFSIDCVGKISYVWGGYAVSPGFDGIRKGLDCSHFIDWVFWTVTGDNLGNSSTMGMGKYMHEITEEDLLPGDLAFTKPPGSKSSKNDANHVLIFMGRTKEGEKIFVDARSEKSGVCMSSYPGAVYFYRPFCLDGQ